MEATPFLGRFSEATLALARAGVAALEGRSAEALAGFRSAVEDCTRAGSGLMAALAKLDALFLLPAEPAIADWADEAREAFEAVRSPALLARLDEAVAAQAIVSDATRKAARDAVSASTLVGGAIAEG